MFYIVAGGEPVPATVVVVVMNEAQIREINGYQVGH